jgi:calcium-dependent protein kinase
VKPDNFLFLNSNEQSGLRAIDFGLAEYCEPGQYLTDR